MILIVLCCVVGGIGLDLTTGPHSIDVNGPPQFVERHLRMESARQWFAFVFAMSCLVAIMLIEVLP